MITAALLVFLGLLIVAVSLIVAINAVSAAHDRRGRARVMETYYSPERMW